MSNYDDQEELLPEYKGYRFYEEEKTGCPVMVDAEGRAYELINPLNYPRSRHATEELVGLWFGSHSPTMLLIWSPRGSYENALEEAAQLLAEHYPGLINSEEEMQALYDEAREDLGDDASDEEVQEAAEVDMTYTESGWITSFEWGDIRPDTDMIDAAKKLSKFLYREEYDEDEED